VKRGHDGACHPRWNSPCRKVEERDTGPAERPAPGQRIREEGRSPWTSELDDAGSERVPFLGNVSAMGHEDNNLARVLAEQGTGESLRDPAEAAMGIDKRRASVETDHGTSRAWYCSGTLRRVVRFEEGAPR